MPLDGIWSCLTSPSFCCIALPIRPPGRHFCHQVGIWELTAVMHLGLVYNFACFEFILVEFWWNPGRTSNGTLVEYFSNQHGPPRSPRRNWWMKNRFCKGCMVWDALRFYKRSTEPTAKSPVDTEESEQERFLEAVQFHQSPTGFRTNCRGWFEVRFHQVSTRIVPARSAPDKGSSNFFEGCGVGWKIPRGNPWRNSCGKGLRIP